MKKNQLAAIAIPLNTQKMLARRDRMVDLTSGQRRCQVSTATRKTQVQTKRWARISPGETAWSSFQYPGINPQVMNAATPASAAEASRDLPDCVGDDVPCASVEWIDISIL